MKQTEGMPEKIWAWLDGDEDGCRYGEWSEELDSSDGVYLKSTPALEHADEMRDILERVAYKTSLQSVEAAKDFLDKLEAEEGAKIIKPGDVLSRHWNGKPAAIAMKAPNGDEAEEKQ